MDIRFSETIARKESKDLAGWLFEQKTSG